MKRFLLFAGADYYPQGGWSDLIQTFNSKEEALEYYATTTYDWFHIIDFTNGKEV